MVAPVIGRHREIPPTAGARRRASETALQMRIRIVRQTRDKAEPTALRRTETVPIPTARPATVLTSHQPEAIGRQIQVRTQAAAAIISPRHGHTQRRAAACQRLPVRIRALRDPTPLRAAITRRPRVLTPRLAGATQHLRDPIQLLAAATAAGVAATAEAEGVRTRVAAVALLTVVAVPTAVAAAVTVVVARMAAVAGTNSN